MDANIISEAQEPVRVPTPPPLKRVNVSAPGLHLDVSRFDHFWDEGLGEFTTQENVHGKPGREQKPGDGYAFSIARLFNRVPGKVLPEVVTIIEIRSPYFLNVAKEIMKDGRTLSWFSDPVTFRIEFLIGYLPKFEKYYQDLEASSVRDEEASYTLEHLSFFLRFFRNEFAQELDEFNKLISQGLITWRYMWSIFLPGYRVLQPDKSFQQSSVQAMRLISCFLPSDLEEFELHCEYLQREENRIGLAEWSFRIPKFEGTKKITDLRYFPLEYHPQIKEVERTLLERGLKWYRLGGMQHKYYDGFAIRENGNSSTSRVEVKSRIIIDKDRYVNKFADNNQPPREVLRTATGETRPFDSDMYSPSIKPPDSALMLAPTFLSGFSLANKGWYLFGLDYIHDIQWDDAAFNHLAIPAPQKELIISLVESHKQYGSIEVDDFIEGKGLGLVISLSGPPGVGKTLTAEVTSEHTRSPLYVVGADEIGSDAGALELNLPQVFSLASAWNAVVLLDEAEVFLEQRSASDLGRNALVAVLLRQLEYFPGILFLTTNRPVVFDKALQSRIHISIHYGGLSLDAKRSIWDSFLSRAKQPNWPEPVMRELITFDLNGRQIKNVVNTANVLANKAEEELSIDHILKVILVNERNATGTLKRGARSSVLDSLLLGSVVAIPPILVCLFMYRPILSTLQKLKS